MMQPQWLADLSDERRARLKRGRGAKRPRTRCGGQERSDPGYGWIELMRIGMVCPYSFDVPGGVQSHILQLAEVMHRRGHEVSVLAPASPSRRRPARLRRLRRQGRADSLQRVGGAAALRSRHPPHGQEMARRRRFRRTAPARAECPQPVDAGAEHRRGPDRGDLPHVDDEVADAVGVRTDPAADAREDRRPHRGVGPGATLADGGAGQ